MRLITARHRGWESHKSAGGVRNIGSVASMLRLLLLIGLAWFAVSLLGSCLWVLLVTTMRKEARASDVDVGPSQLSFPY